MTLRSLRSYSSSRRGRLPAAIAGLGLMVASGSADAASWGSFDETRIAYSTGALTGDAHSELRALIMENNDEVAAPTGELTAEYLAGVDVFYTAMLSDGTGPTAGELGTLSLTEQMALQDWIASGGTLVVNPDSNGFGGPWPAVYDTVASDYGVENYAFVPGPGEGEPFAVHPLTQGVTSYSLDGSARFDFPAEGELIGTAISDTDPLLVVFEPASGFVEGGRMLFVADHNALTDNLIAELDNQVLATNIVQWAAGECGNTIVESNEECDDGNTDDGDDCSSTCMVGSGGESSGGASSSGDGSMETGQGPVDSSGGAATGSGGDATPGTTSSDAATGGSSGGEPAGDGGGGGCAIDRGAAPFGSLGIAMLMVFGCGWRRRRA
ncbi:MAG: hypothetical protein K0V04_02680 [Deltaproteobacteria bacterium]|nr:hypothetical protein [Deltaproteobacteria bacterium]